MLRNDSSGGMWSHRSMIIFVIVIVLTSLMVMYTKYNNVESLKYDLSVETKSQCDSYCLRKEQTFKEKCHWYFVNYTPSAWESVWYNNIEQLQNNVCGTLTRTDNVNKSVLLMQRLIELQKFGRNQKNGGQHKNDEIFSRMFYRQRCIDSQTNVYSDVKEISQLIEPLIGLLRDPLTICSRLSNTQVPSSLYEDAILLSKRHILLSISAPFYISSSMAQRQTILTESFISNNFNSNIPPWMYKRSITKISNMNEGKRILFDLGSSFYGKNVDISETSTRWFYEYYKRLNLQFDRIIAFELRPLDPKTAWEQLPDDVFPVYTLINTGCTETGIFNPWVMLQQIAKPEDHVIVKLDIDSFNEENFLINQVLNNSTIHSLIDEFFFEHHVSVTEMLAYWRPPPGKLKDSYILFTKLRQLGIRMHGWP
ncbi:unnamed protein product [Adineta steineri]|uniref:Uncharacterized protein n=2 Tax=Adineta steineri TaxID=433720 RepID=A0A813W7K3_9BILA|nr:unnamed protein product [Adineta steineri]CAF0846782.1 unnamed protein product [Adineta steineri]